MQQPASSQNASSNLPALPKYKEMALQAKDLFLEVADEKVWMKEIGFAMQILEGNTLLQRSAPESIKNAVINVALCGATLNPAMQMAYLVPRDGKCCLDISYRGLAQIAMASGGVKSIQARCVYSFDTFEYSELDGETHVKYAQQLLPPPEFTCDPTGKFWDFLVCGYVIATLPDGSKLISQPLPKWKLEKAMKTSKTSGEKTPWRTHPDEMCLKTLVKHAYKLLPQTDRMSRAVHILNEHEGLALEAGAGTKTRAHDIANRFMDPEDAELTSAAAGAQKAGDQAAGVAPTGKGEPQNGGEPAQPGTVELVSSQQIEDLQRMVREFKADEGKFLAAMKVDEYWKIAAAQFGEAVKAIQKSAPPKTDTSSESGPKTISTIISALASRHIPCETDETAGMVVVKLAASDTESREIVKSLGFRWDSVNKYWHWRQS
jgi:recombination protein RecT